MTEIRRQIDQYLDQLPNERLNIVLDFLAHLSEGEAATQELLNIPGFIESFEKGKQQLAEGRMKNWRAIRTDV